MSTAAIASNSGAIWGNSNYRISLSSGSTIQGTRRNARHLTSTAELPKQAATGTLVSVVDLWRYDATSPVAWTTLEVETELRRKDALIAFLSSDDAKGSWCLNLSEESRKNTVLFLKSLGRHQITPTLMEDGEGDTILIWGDPAVLIVTVEGDQLHCVINPGKPNAVYPCTEAAIDGKIPWSVLKRVPSIEHSSFISL